MIILPRVAPQGHVQGAAVSELPAALSVWAVARPEQRPETVRLTTEHCQVHGADLPLPLVTIPACHGDQLLQNTVRSHREQRRTTSFLKHSLVCITFQLGRTFVNITFFCCYQGEVKLQPFEAHHQRFLHYQISSPTASFGTKLLCFINWSCFKNY